MTIILVAILLMVVGGYYICGHFINGYWRLFLVYSRLYYNYWWLFCYKLLLDILCYIIINYW